jgi:internalin A
MTTDEAYEEARRRIGEAERTGAEALDLGDLLLAALPEELSRLTTLRHLALGRKALRRTESGWDWAWDNKRPYQTRLVDLRPLAGLSGLHSLGLSGCDAVTDLQPLAGLSSLHSLDLDGCRAVTDLQPLAGLSGLQSLNLRACQAITDLRPLAGLSGLQSLNLAFCVAVTDLRPLAGLSRLQSLDLNFFQAISDLQPLAGLSGLQSLNLRACQAVTDLRPLAGLSGLRSLDLRECTRIDRFEPLRPLLKHLEHFLLYGCAMHDLPNELFGESIVENVIDKVRAHYADLERDAVDELELKVCILGNGGVGKTQMCRRLALPPQPFDPLVRTTHGIELGHTEVTIDGRSVRLSLWDFGGQDIYHGSHALFVGGRGMFVIAWSPSHEMGESHAGGATFRNRPLSYWLDFVRGLAGPNVPVLVVQCQCDSPADERAAPLPPHDFRRLRTMRFSAKTDLGLTLLRGELEEGVRDFFARQPPLAIGRGRVEVRNQLRTMLVEDQRRLEAERRHRTLTRAEFDELCRANGKVSSPDALLEYLHRSGVLFHREGLFDDRILLDQNWALAAIYTLFDRERIVPLLHRHGRFTRAELECLVWKEFSVAEQRLFLDLMEQCGICFRVRELDRDERGKREWEYVAPELLPAWSSNQEWLPGRMQGGKERGTITARYRFLHEGILRGLLSRVGRKASTAAEYWKYGCWFYDKSTESQVLIRSELEESSGQGSVTLEATGERPRELLEILLEELLSLQVGEPPSVERSWELEAVPRAARPRTPRKPKRRKPESAVEEIAAGDEVPGPAEGMQQLDVGGWPPPPPNEPATVYISYAWGDDTNEAGRQRGEIADKLCEVVEREGFRMLRDKREMRTGDWISTFMERIGRGAHILVVLSEKYFQSRYCMRELHSIYERSLGNKEDFLQRVMPVFLDDVASLGGLSSYMPYVEAWKRECDEMERQVAHWGKDEFELYQRMRKWQIDLGNIVGFLTDPVYPRGRGAIEKDDYAALKEMLAKVRRNGG